MDININKTRVVASSKDKFAYVWDLQKKQLLEKLCFKYSIENKNMIMRDCLFHSDGSILTLATEARQPTFVVKWVHRKHGDKETYSERPEVGCANPKNASTGMRLS